MLNTTPDAYYDIQIEGVTFMKKQICSILLALALVCSMLVSACAPKVTTQPETEATVTQTDATVTVTDASGRVVEVTSDVQRIVTAYATRYVLAFGMGENIVNSMTDNLSKYIDPSFADGEPIMRDGALSVEGIAEMNPDVFIHRGGPGSTDIYNSLELLGIPSVGIIMENVDEILATVRLLGKTLSREERAQELCDYYLGMIDKAKKLTADIPGNERVTAILMGGSLGMVAHGGMLQSVMMETAGAIPMAADVDADGIWPVVGVETIFEWDPEYIFVQNMASVEYTVADLKADPGWSELQAVKNDRVFVVASELDSWEFPGLQSAIGIMWMISIMYPELYSAEELDSDVNEFYELVYGVSADREALGY